MSKCKICKTEFDTEEGVFCPKCQSYIDKIDKDKDLDPERKWLEELFMKRYNNFLLLFSLIATAGFANTLHNWRYFVFYFGTVFLFLYWYTGVRRAYYKYDTLVTILKFMKKNPGQTAVIEIQERRKHNKQHLIKIHVGYYVAIVIPLLCVFFLLSVAILINCCVIK